ncbi:MAG: hypothetical protein LBD23_02940 [Oscillospiraceae bacterium]|jgi:hypothetical protein|nr:hypothetical protein [Oscillospiraceae bacterium]
MWKNNLKSYIKLIPVSLGFIIVIATLSIVYGFVAHRLFTLRYIFDANFLSAAILIVIGTILMFLQSSLKIKDRKLLDHSTFVERSFDSREEKQQKARLVLWLGIYCMIMTGLIQLFLSFIMI